VLHYIKHQFTVYVLYFIHKEVMSLIHRAAPPSLKKKKKKKKVER